MLELHDAAGAFRSLERYLEDERFGERADVVADLFLGYGLSAAIRREPGPAPPEPFPLPLLACRIRPAEPRDTSPPGGARIGEWERSWTDAGYAAAIEAVRAAIARGDVYQVSVVQHLSAPFDGDPNALASALAPLRPLAAAPLDGDGWTIVSASPELFLSRRGSRVWTMPIKGTVPAAGASDVLHSEKNAAEHVMIVDLERNDLSRVCRPGSVRWPELMAERELAGVVHLVSKP